MTMYENIIIWDVTNWTTQNLDIHLFSSHYCYSKYLLHFSFINSENLINSKQLIQLQSWMNAWHCFLYFQAIALMLNVMRSQACEMATFYTILCSGAIILENLFHVFVILTDVPSNIPTKQSWYIIFLVKIRLVQLSWPMLDFDIAKFQSILTSACCVYHMLLYLLPMLQLFLNQLYRNSVSWITSFLNPMM